uniref:Uncharacterized protein n=1 Tax=Nicotiana tabacum TaxID=4097 RepID=A0A1S3Y868_TOBAC|nr:PREDICTED: uncharacterized protein LOC107773312 [Nicotiana tabacum]
MGIWDFINSGKETLKGYTPDPVKKVYNTTYYYSVVSPSPNRGKAVTKIYFDTVREMETKCQKKQDESSLRLLDGAEMLESRELKLGSENRVEVDSFAYQTPEYVLRVFMMGTRYLDNLLVTVNWEKLNLHIKVE